MLKHSWKWLQAGGWMMWVVYAHHVTPDAAAFLAKHCKSVDVWRLPGLHLGEYVHVVVVAQEGTPPDEPAQFAQRILQDAANPRELTVQDTPLYTFPSTAHYTPLCVRSESHHAGACITGGAGRWRAVWRRFSTAAGTSSTG